MRYPPFAQASMLLIVVGFVGVGDLASALGQTALAKVQRFARFQVGNTVAYGLVENDQVRQLDGDLFGEWKPGEKTYPLDSVKLLVPVERLRQVIALAGSYKSHLGGSNQVTTVVTTTKVTTNTTSGETTTDSNTTVDSVKPGEVPETFRTPQVFFKTPSCLIADGENIVLPRGSKEVRYEAELVIVIGRTTSKVSEKEAPAHILGVTCGNDVSARDWQKNDVQWWRARGATRLAPLARISPQGSTTTTCWCSCGSTARRCRRRTPANSSTACPSWSVSSASTSPCTRAI